jgi:hypothetical protein
MARKRLPAVFLVGGMALKGLLVIAWRLSKAPALLALLTTYDPAGFWFAERTTALLFDHRRIAPTPVEAATFEVLLIVGFGIECLIAGLVISWILRRPRPPQQIESPLPGR